MFLYTAIYRLAISVYFAAIRIAATVNGKAQLFVQGRKNLLPRMRQALEKDARKRLWMHCASLGEFEQGRPVLEALHEHYPEYAVVVTFFSPSGYEVRKNYEGADYVFYLPMDTPGNARTFLDIVQPSLCIFVKYEFWYYYLSNIAQRNIPAILVSAIFNKDQGFFKWFGGLQRQMLRSFRHIFVQDGASVELLGSIKISGATLSGDTRFDRVIKAAEAGAELPVLTTFAHGHKLLIAGSTWLEDEKFLHKALQLLPDEWKIVLAPHEVNAEHLRQIEDLFAGNIIKWSQFPHELNHPVNGKEAITERVLLIDKVGLLLQVYRYGRISWIGGGFGRAGVHNVLEAAVYGQPCYFGPIYHQFLEARELVDIRGAFTCKDAKEFAAAIEQMEVSHAWKQFADSAKNYVYSKAGATGVILSYIDRSGFL